ncbi:MAG: PqqD family protein [Myxococcaceae bacterium]|nr:PqqD family protein [Myxococcaceae bacterium]MCI0672305.1 PqqD family protein [Myxococcaceae bacterium]
MSGAIPRRRQDLVVGELAGGAEVVLLDSATEKVVSLNSSAAAIWYLCDGRRDAAAIAQEVLETLPGLEPRAVGDEVRRTLETLASHGLLEG